MKTLILLAFAAVLSAQTTSTFTPDQFYTGLQTVLTNYNKLTAANADLTSKLAAAGASVATLQSQLNVANAQLQAQSGSCLAVPQPWQDMLRQLLADGQQIAGIAHFQTPDEAAEWTRITGHDGLQ